MILYTRGVLEMFLLLVLSTLRLIDAAKQGVSIRPKFFSGTDGSQVTSVTREDIQYLHHLVMEISLNSEHLILDLNLRSDAANDTEPLFLSEDREMGKYPLCDETKSNRYDGKIRSMSNSSVHLIICKKIWCFIRNNDETIIFTSVDSQKNVDVINFEDELILYQNPNLFSNNVDLVPILLDDANFRRSKREERNFRDTRAVIPKRIIRYIKLALVVDYEMYELVGKNSTKLNERYKNITNIVNSFLLDYNVYVALVDVVIWRDGNKIAINDRNPCDTSRYFKEYGIPLYGDDVKMERINQMFLMTGFFFPSNYYCFDAFEICTSSFGLVEDCSRSENFVAELMITVLARHMGVQSSIESCSKGNWDTWKLCAVQSMSQLEDKLEKFTCLNSKPAKLLNTPVCGNAVVEQGELCDCGKLVQCDNLCCDPATCMPKINVDCCDSTTGTISSKSTICRPISHQFDIAEYCDGESIFCPVNECRNTGEWNSSAVNEAEYNIPEPYNSNNSSRIVELALVIDYSLFIALGGNITEVNRRYQKVTNIVNAFFQEFNICVVLTNVEIWPCQDRIEIQRNATTTCNNFEKYVKSLLYDEYNIDVVHLISKKEFDWDIDNYCNIGDLCTSTYGISVDNLNNIDDIVRKLVLALVRKMKINLDEACVCSLGKCFRWHFFTGNLSWSHCTVESMARIVADKERFSCLNNKPERLFGESSCGNGFTELGEECDCGVVEKCDNPCCDPETCMFRANASCAVGKCCDLKTCKVYNSSTICRPVQHQCDLVEYCDGKSEHCPADNCKNSGKWSPDETDQEKIYDEIRGPSNANKTSRFIELALVVDNGLYQALNSNLTEVNQRYKNIVNVVNAHFQELNVFVALVNVEVWSCRDQINIGKNITITYNKFVKYAQTNLMNKNIDTIQLITNFKLDVAAPFYTTSKMCSSASGVVTDDLKSSEMIAENLAYVLMLNMGINLIRDNCTFTPMECVTPSNCTRKLEWSPCAIHAVTQALTKRQNLWCLNNEPIRLFDGPVCGNGFTEQGEECDCGLEGKCDNPCCDATSCKLNINASCAIGECCDLKTCTIFESTTVCRPELEECDLPEYCDGESEYCPFDTLKTSDQSCSRGPRCDIIKHRCKGPRQIIVQKNESFPSEQKNEIFPTEQNDECFPTEQKNESFPTEQKNENRPTAQKNENPTNYLVVILIVLILSLILLLIFIVYVNPKLSICQKYRFLPSYSTPHYGTSKDEGLSVQPSPVPPHSAQQILNSHPSESNISNCASNEQYSHEYECVEINKNPFVRFDGNFSTNT